MTRMIMMMRCDNHNSKSEIMMMIIKIILIEVTMMGEGDN